MRVRRLAFPLSTILGLMLVAVVWRNFAGSTQLNTPTPTDATPPTVLSAQVDTPSLRFRATLTTPSGTTFYVSKRGSNGEGTSWASAWNELDQIRWGAVRPGDTILLDGGVTEMVYTSTLTVGASGNAGQPITVRVAGEPDRNGKVAIFGGRTEPLPFCYQPKGEYIYQAAGVRENGISLDDASWVIIDGTRWRGIAVYGHRKPGISLTTGTSNVTLRYVEVYDNGNATLVTNPASGHFETWYPDLPGVSLSGTASVFERAIIHDNGQDSFQSEGGLGNFTLRDSWLYNSRVDPAGAVWNYCRHPDGIQIYGGGEQYGVTVEGTIIGPGFMNGLLLGAPVYTNQIGKRQWATIHDVTISNSLLFGNRNVNITANIDPMAVNPRNWIIERVTSDRITNEKWQNVQFWGDADELTVTDSIFTGGWSMSVPARGNYRGNTLYWMPPGNYPLEIGEVVDPHYANTTAHGSTNLEADFTVAPGSPATGKGSRVTSAEALLSAGR